MLQALSLLGEQLEYLALIAHRRPSLRPRMMRFLPDCSHTTEGGCRLALIGRGCKEKGL